MDSKKVRAGVCIYAADMDMMAQFYKNTLGLDTDWTGGDFAEFKTASGELSLFMYSREAFVQAIGEKFVVPEGINTTFEIALWLPTYADVDAEYQRLSKLNVSFPTGEPQTFTFGIRNFYVADPEGNLLEIGSACEK